MNNAQHRGTLPAAASSIEDPRHFERLLARLSARFINLPTRQVDAAITDALREFVEALGVDRCQLIRISARFDEAVVTHSWARAGVQVIGRESLAKLFPWVLQRLRAGHAVAVARMDELPLEAHVDKASWWMAGGKSSLVAPVKVGGRIEGALVFGCTRQERDWDVGLVEQVTVLAEILGNSLAHKRAQEDLEVALRFERLLADISASVLRVASSDTEAAIGNAMQAIGRFLEVERVAFWVMRGVRFELEREWVSDGAAAPRAAGTGIDASHSLFGLLQHGEVVNLADVEAQLPSGCGNRALLAIPLLDNGVVVGALSFEAMHAARSWPDTLIPRIRLIGEAFASVLAHRRAIEQVHDAQVDAAQHRERLAHMARVHTMGEMSAAIAHEVNQPLVAIENYALAARRRLASSTTSDIGKIDELLSKIRVQAARAGDVIQRLRAMVKRHEYEVAHADLGRLVTGAVELAEMESRLTGLQIRIHMACAPTPVLVDEIQIQQVVLNLIRNGIEAMASGQAEGLALTVEVTRAGEAEAVVRVIDSGPGIEPGNEERIFEPFYSTKATGLGIGLAVCRSIVESHGGRLRYVPNPGGGAAFEFTLPIADEEEEP